MAWVNTPSTNFGVLWKYKKVITVGYKGCASITYFNSSYRPKLVVTYTTATAAELVSFNAKIRNNVAHLDWAIATEVNYY